MNIFYLSCFVLCISSAAATGLLRYCAPRKIIHGVHKVQNVCKTLQKTQQNLQCVTAADRMTCYKMLVDGQVDFMVAEPEDLRMMINTYDKTRIVVTHQLKMFEDLSPQLGVEMIVIVKNGFNKPYRTKGKKLCYLGLETSHKTEFDYYYTAYFESSQFPRNCDRSKSLLENRIASLSQHFNSSCIAGPWSLDPVIDNELKAKYKNLCALCANPSKCSEDDKYYGMNGALECLREKVGDIAWISKSYAAKYATQLTRDGFSLLCPDGALSVLPANLNNSCTWITDPRPVIIANTNVGLQVLHLITDEGPQKTRFSSVVHASYKFSHLHKLQVPEDLRNYLMRIPRYYGAALKALSTCRSDRSVRWCVASKLEARKCKTLEKVANALAIHPIFSCVTLNSRDECIKAVSNGSCDVFVSKPEEEYKAKKLGVRPIIDIMPNKQDESNKIAAIVRKKSIYNSYSDLKGAKACFTGFRSAGWNAFFSTLKNGSISSDEEDIDTIANYFKESCVLGMSPKNLDVPKNLYSLCKQYDDKLNSEEKTFKCLMDGADVAFVNITVAKKFASKSVVFNTNYKLLCPTEERKKENTCYLTKINMGSILAHENTTKVRRDDIYSMFLALDRYFGEVFDRETPMFDMYEPFEGVPDVIFPDNAMKFERAAKYGRYAGDLDPSKPVNSSGAYVHYKFYANHLFLAINSLLSLYLFRIGFSS